MYNTTIFIEYQCSCPVRYYRNCKNQDNKTIAYCSIGIKDSKTGTITDGNGNYKLEIPDEAKNKEIIFTAAGYSDKSIPANELKTNSNIVMDYKVTNIEAVVIGSKKLKENNWSKVPSLPYFF